ncbi:phosphopantetheine-binding protein [Mycoplasma sp. 2045]|uniref:acyl carrier protein n=1 Tax=unclassified Mycoplasma TaxID=2683645 RepID=UPI00211B7842|nr:MULTISPECIES: phosphopantetheine-binding protein [unclassified Mycoplasma]MEA4134714.1 phosphopantetheine-binding protein [Mycoplasma sp. 2704]MEA4191308.1 phosphopantetheine-binding protein [Mycoplasma sp. 2248]MEA4206456.1 phosphopantetheine-binding protein [Mycoplasma sp. 1199]MEA4276554.1 phosphopantetheine-binding protein [Mycoplasma sp. 21DD0573]MEA4333868.1 phosphopantetheine-binding protein [Mycoplasma sp. 1232]
MNSNIKDLVFSELKKISKNKNITEDSNIRELGVDSLDLAELIFDAEERLGITISDDELRDVKTVKDVIRILDK